MIEKLKKLIERASVRGYVRALKKEPELLNWVLETSQTLPNDVELAERVYVALYGVDEAFCENGNHKNFNAINKGYRFCAPGCQCRREEQARKITENQANVSPEERARRTAKQEETLMKNHNVKNPMHIPTTPGKIKATNNIRHGGDHHMANPLVRAKIVATNTENLGVPYPGMSPLVREKIEATNMQNHGRKDTMHIARAAFAKQYGVENPFMLQIFQDKADQTMMERYGVKKALEDPAILAEMIAHVQAEYGYPTVLMVPAIKQRIMETIQRKYNRKYVNQDHIPEEAYAILQDPEAFREMFKTRSLREVAMELGLSYDGTRRHCVRHGVELPRSSYEGALAAFLSEYAEVKRSDRTIIKPYEIDIVIPSIKIGFEFCGLYWHGEKFKDGPDYHLKKLNAANEAGYRLVTIFEDEWILQQEIVKTRIAHILGMGERGIGARKAEIRNISSNQAFDFYEMHHIQGGGARGFVDYGAFYNGIMIAAMSFAKGRIVTGSCSSGPIELLRFATDGRNHPGIASRLFQTFVKEYQPHEVISYADRRWSDGGLYKKLGFDYVSASKPNYWYVHNNKLSREHRFKYRKDQIKNRVENGHLKSEREIMIELGYYRIWDCGTLTFKWSR